MTDDLPEPDWSEYDVPSEYATINSEGKYVCTECDETVLVPRGKRACEVRLRRYGHVWFCPTCEAHRII